MNQSSVNCCACMSLFICVELQTKCCNKFLLQTQNSKFHRGFTETPLPTPLLSPNMQKGWICCSKRANPRKSTGSKSTTEQLGSKNKGVHAVVN